jgi:hypothetical protein
MRWIPGVVLLGAALLVAGCNGATKWGGVFRSSQPGPIPNEVPTATALVDYLNRNAQRVQSIEVQELDLDCKQKTQSVGLRGKLVCQKPRNFRLGASVVGSQAVDLGSNDQEFWFWISKADPPYLFHCKYADYARGGVRMPFPFQPEWIIEALGMGEYGPAENYELKVQPNAFVLSQWTRSAQGQQVRKVTVFSRGQAQAQVTDCILQDAQGREICSAHIAEAQNVNGVILPRRVTLRWPAEQIELKLKLDEVSVNRPIDGQQHAALFTRPAWPNVQSYDLARGPDAPAGQVRPAGGVPR